MMQRVKRITITLVFIFMGIRSPELINTASNDLALTWADTRMSGMTLDEKIGQLFMIQAYSDKGDQHVKTLLRAIEKYKIGSVAFFQGTPDKQAEITAELQKSSRIPLLVAMDAEYGPGMRLQNTISYPKAMTLGAIQDNQLIYNMGKEIAGQLRRIGVHINFAPVADLNSVPDNPIIHDRSFGDDKREVARKAFAYMKGMQDAGLIACVKHFPGHGNTRKDSHKTLPTISKTLAEMHDYEMFPFKYLINKGVKSVMVGHLHVPSMDSRPNRPASLSNKIIEETLRNEFGFRGLVMTDALDMAGVTDHFDQGDIEVEAFLAGNDILTVSRNFAKAFNSIKSAVNKGKITHQRLNASVSRILIAKFEAGLFFTPEIKLEGITKDLNNQKALALKQELYANALTYFPGKKMMIPVQEPGKQKIATVCIGSGEYTPFQQRFSDFSEARHYNFPVLPKADVQARLLKQLEAYDQVVIQVLNMNKSQARSFGVSAGMIRFIHGISAKIPVTTVLFGTPYSLRSFNQEDDILLGFEPDAMMQDMAAQAVFGAIPITGRLPVNVNASFSRAAGESIPELKILSYKLPENVGMSSDTLNRIRMIVEDMIKDKAAPGCQVMVVKDGAIVFNEAFGNHDYSNGQPVLKDDIFDLASVTKVIATTLGTMKLYEEGRIDLFETVGKYVKVTPPESKIKDLELIDILTHHAGLKAWIPFYQATIDTLENNKLVPSRKYYSKVEKPGFKIKVADNFYLRNDYLDSMKYFIYSSEPGKPGNYLYSDLGFYIMQDIIEQTAGMSLDQYVRQEFYIPLGLRRTCFKPLENFDKSNIPPTESDDYFRMQEVRGYVHDMGAAMLGGVSGHAGLFSNSRELAVIMQMLLNKGVYGKRRYLNQQTVYTFTTRFNKSSRRGIGFDMKELDATKNKNMSALASSSTFGHLGFTGTCVWADPEKQLIYIFLSNRTYPSMHNDKLVKKDYRTRIQSVIYKSLNS